MTPRAKSALAEADVVLGYKTYLAQIEKHLQGKEIRSSTMTKELDRAGSALDLACAGKVTALVSGGDPGIYAMAGLVFELIAAREIPLGKGPDKLNVKVIPGVTAFTCAAAILGAPLNHDFASISLSTRLTPWEVITKKLDLAAQADFVIALYNPKSRGRDWQFNEALKIIGESRGPQTPVGIVQKASRPSEAVNLTTLKDAASAEVDMQTVVIIGNSRTYRYLDKMITPRGYKDKYDLSS